MFECDASDAGMRDVLVLYPEQSNHNRLFELLEMLEFHSACIRSRYVSALCSLCVCGSDLSTVERICGEVGGGSEYTQRTNESCGRNNHSKQSIDIYTGAK